LKTYWKEELKNEVVLRGYWRHEADDRLGRGLTRGLTSQSIQEPLVVTVQVRRPPDDLGVSKSVECDTYPFTAFTLLLGDGKGIPPVTS